VPPMKTIAEIFAIVHHIDGAIEVDDAQRRATIKDSSGDVTVRQWGQPHQPCAYDMTGPHGGTMASMMFDHILTDDYP
jgi:hypothetical protein